MLRLDRVTVALKTLERKSVAVGKNPEVTESDSSDCVGVRGSQQEADRHRPQSCVENTRPRERSVLEHTQL